MQRAKGFGRTAPLSARTAAVFAATLALCLLLTTSVITNRMETDRYLMEQVILEKSQDVTRVISRLLYKTDVLAALVVQNDGEIHNFAEVAGALIDDDAIQNVLMAPGGVVRDVYPDGDRDSMYGFDFFSDMAGNLEAQAAVEKGELVFSGPFTGVQGREILSGRLPVWLEGEAGRRVFWGIVSVTLKYPEALVDAGLDQLRTQGLGYEIWRTNPDDGQRQVIARSEGEGGRGAGYIERRLSLFNAEWYFRLSPVRAWHQYTEAWLLLAASLALCCFIAYIVENNARLKRMQKALEAQEVTLRRAAQTAQEASRMKSTFLATVSHEIRTPMNGIIGYSDLAMADEALSPQTRGYLLNIERSAGGLMQIIDELLDISKIEAGKVELEDIPFTVHKVFDECASINTPKAAEKGIGLTLREGPDAHRWLRGDPTKLRQILLNLLSNAIKFTGVGSVEMTCETLAATEGSLTLRFTVTDSGIGMTREELARVGESFTQADSSTRRRYGGTGLGLAISQNLIQLMGGSLTAQSTPSVGSRFSFALTLPTAEAPQAQPPPGEGRQPVFTGHVLVCEDNATNSELARDQLTRAGLTVALARDGQEGVALARRQMERGAPFDLILMDIQMPVMDGMEASLALARLGSRTPVIAMTANVMASDRDAYREAGMPDCLAKPVAAGALRDCLLRHLTPTGWVEKKRYAPLPQERGAVIHRDLGLRMTDGDEEWYQRLLLRFVDEQADIHDKIARALRRGDVKQAARLAHSLKGVGNLIGAVRLSAAAARVESAIAAGEAADIGEQMALLARELEAVMAEIQPSGGE